MAPLPTEGLEVSQVREDLDDLTVCELCLWHYEVAGECARGNPGS